MLTMKVVCFLSALVLAVNAVPIPEEERLSGWYVPQIDGSYRWLTLDEGEQILADAEEQEAESQRIMGRASSTVPVTFYLYTNKNPKEAQEIAENDKSIENCNFDGSNPTRFIIHGWTQSYDADLFVDLRDAWLSRGDYNVILIDWALARSVNYVSSVAAAPKTGQKIASMLDYLVENYDMDLAETEVIGHSLGAHVAGHTGKNLKTGKLHAIIALDAALPLYSFEKPSERLNEDDAEYVESIHTNGGKLGFLEPIGKSAFYVNGGRTQPGCGLDLTFKCVHQRSVVYYTEAVLHDSFPSMRCGDFKEAVKKGCGASYSSVKMGTQSNAHVGSGAYYVPINGASPFGYAFGARV